jgi:methylthioribose-1-phosphate isomerase
VRTAKIDTIVFENGTVTIIDQTLLPEQYVRVRVTDHLEMADHITRLAIRGAPALGIAAAFGLYLGMKDAPEDDHGRFKQRFSEVRDILVSTRPTAVNIEWACDTVESTVFENEGEITTLKSRLLESALRIYEDDLERSRKIGEYGETLIGDGMSVITHCNAGGLATGGLGTALAPMFLAREKGKKFRVYVDETRPLLQGSRLTAWELQKVGIEATVICDSMSAWVMKNNPIDLVFVGADRVARNGDIANKIGTYLLAIAASAHDVPFYVAAPISSFDPSVKSGDEIPIEIRSEEEVVCGFGKRTAPRGIDVLAPAFDITPFSCITGIITEKGVVYPPFEENISAILHE